MFADQGCSDPYSGSNLSLDSSTNILTFDTTTPSEQLSAFMCVKNSVDAEQFVHITYQVCGLEELSLKTSSEFLIKSYAVDSGSHEIPITLFETKFVSSIPECEIKSYSIMQKNGNKYEEYEGTDLEIDERDFTITIETSNPDVISAFIEASTQDSESKAYLPLQIFLTNTPPTFTEEIVAIEVELVA